MSEGDGKRLRLSVLIALVAIYMIVEVVVGYISNSLALISDALHMLSDLLALITGLAAVSLATRASDDRRTYGWRRAETLAAVANGTFLLGLCFDIAVRAFQRFIEVEIIEKPELVLGVGIGGLVVNLIGLVLFHDHSHHGHHLDIETGDEVSIKHHDLNARGIFLHVLGDALGSISVVVSALFVMLFDGQWRFYIDPVVSLAIVLVLASTTVPLLRRAGRVLLQTAPAHINVEKLREKISLVEGVSDVHELHIWELFGECAVATVHLVVDDGCDFMPVAHNVRWVLHNAGVHSATIQPEWYDEYMFVESDDAGEERCLLQCPAECDASKCCIVVDDTVDSPLIGESSSYSSS